MSLSFPLSPLSVKEYYESHSGESSGKAMFAEQIRREAEALQGETICHLPNARKYSLNAQHIQPQKIKDEINSRFYSFESMESALCTMNKLFIGSSHLQMTRRLKYWIRNLEQIGEDSANGYAMRGELGDISGLFVIKVSKPGKNDLTHELFVGSHLNTLRKSLPTFSYVYGGFKCLPPFLSEKRVQTWCNTKKSEQNVTYVLYENIYPSISFREYLKTCTTQQFLTVYLQILYSLRLAQDEFKFTHYDLHDENILLRGPYPSPFLLPYETPRGKEYILTEYIPTIIDFGMSYLEVDGEGYGVFGFEHYGVKREMHPLFDAYKLLGFSLGTLYRENRDVYDETRHLLRFFFDIEDDKLDEFVQEQREYYYFLPPVDLKDGNIDLLSEMIRREFVVDSVFSGTDIKDGVLYLHPRSRYTVLECNNPLTPCPSSDSLFIEWGLGSPPTLYTLFDVVDYIRRTGDRSPLKQTEWMATMTAKSFELLDSILAEAQMYKTRPVVSVDSGVSEETYADYLSFMTRYSNDYILYNEELSLLKSVGMSSDRIERYTRDGQEMAGDLSKRNHQVVNDYKTLVDKEDEFAPYLKTYLDAYGLLKSQ